MAELAGREHDLVTLAEERGVPIFKGLCEVAGDRILFSCLRVIVSIAQQRGLVLWFTESESIQ
jgi:hypothetical protein